MIHLCILVSDIDTGKIKGIIVAWTLISKNRANTMCINSTGMENEKS